jgi:hypothetical protein
LAFCAWLATSKNHFLSSTANNLAHSGLFYPTTELTYSYLDTAPLAGINYYRLVQTDRDGTATRSKIIALSRDGALVPVLYPNPVSASGEPVLEPAIAHSGYQLTDVLAASCSAWTRQVC